MLIAAFLLSASAALAQDELRLPADLWSAPPAALAAADPEAAVPWTPQDDFDRGRPRRDTDLVVNAAVHGRYSIPFGSANRDVFIYGAVFVVDNHLSWAELFRPGFGFDLEFDVMFGDANKLGRSRTPGFDYGAFLAVMHDEYGGDKASDEFGNFIKADDMTVSTVLVGGKVIQSFDQGFFADGRFGIGAVHYSAVQATFGGPLTPDFRDELFEDTWTFALDLRGHGGVRLGPLGLTAGLGFRMLVPPSEGGRVDLDSGPIWVFDIEIGAEIGF